MVAGVLGRFIGSLHGSVASLHTGRRRHSHSASQPCSHARAHAPTHARAARAARVSALPPTHTPHCVDVGASGAAAQGARGARAPVHDRGAGAPHFMRQRRGLARDGRRARGAAPWPARSSGSCASRRSAHGRGHRQARRPEPGGRASLVWLTLPHGTFPAWHRTPMCWLMLLQWGVAGSRLRRQYSPSRSPDDTVMKHHSQIDLQGRTRGGCGDARGANQRPRGSCFKAPRDIDTRGGSASP